jgi:hypothetical protein
MAVLAQPRVVIRMKIPKPAVLASALELVLAVALCLFALWFLAPRAANQDHVCSVILLSLVAFALIWIFWFSPRCLHSMASSIRGIGSRRYCFLRIENLGRSLRNFGAITALGLGMLVVIRLARDPQLLPVLSWKLILLKFAGYLFFGFGQALFYFEFCQPRLRITLGDRGAVWGTVLIFTVFHIPNLSLIGMGLVACYLWAREYLQRPNLLLLTLSHAILGSSLLLIDGIFTRVGPFYWHPEQHAMRAILPFWGNLVHGLW